MLKRQRMNQIDLPARLIAVASYEHNIEHNGLFFEHCSKA